ncbi:MAG: hypothetical protein RL654_98 [Pseudomonadota bacterium]|jgi:hypothetical protein
MSFWTKTLRPVLKVAAAVVAAVYGQYAIAASLLQSGVSDHQKVRAGKKARAAYNAAQRDRQQMVASATNPRQDVYGRQVVSGTVLFKHSAGAKKECLYLAVELARHEIDAIEAVYIGDVEVTGWATNGDVTSGAFVKGQSGVSLAQRTGPGTITIAPPAGSTATIVSAHKSTDTGDVDITASVTLSGSTVTVPSAAVAAGQSVYVNWAWSLGKPLVRIYPALGGADQTAFAAWQAEIGDKWTSAHRLRGRAAVGVRLEYDQDVFGAMRDISVRARVRGKKLRDPRTGLTVYSNNTALITADLLRTRMGATAAQVPDAEIAAEADICDQITVGQKRYTCDIALSTDLSPKDSLDLVRETMDGSVVWTQGRWRVRAGAWHEPDITLTAADLADGARTITPRAQRQSLCNTVVATYTSPAANWVLVPAPAVRSSVYLDQDGGYELPMQISIEGATDEIRAQRLARIELEKSRNGAIFGARWSANAYDLVPGDTCYVQIDRYFGALPKAFAVVERKLDLQSLEIDLTLRETASGIWEWSGAIGQDLTPNTTLPSPFAPVAMPAGVTAISGNSTLLRLADGTVISRVALSWTQHPDAFVASGGRIEVEWRRASGDTSWIGVPPVGGDATGTVIGPLDDRAAVLIRVRAVNAAGRSSAWRIVSHIVAGKSALPTAPTALAVTEGASGERIYSVTHVQDLDHAGYIVRASGVLTATWDQMAQVAAWTGATTQHRSGSPGDGQWRFAVRAVDTSGNLSVPIYVTATLTQQAIGWSELSGVPGNLAGLTGAEQIRNDQLASSANMLFDSDFTAGPESWALSGALPIVAFGRNYHANWILNAGVGPSTGTIFMSQDGPSGGTYSEITSEPIAVLPGDRICASAYTGAHRCNVDVFAYFYGENGVTGSTWGAGTMRNSAETNGGQALSGYKRCYSIGVAPAGTRTCRLVLRKYDTHAGQTSSFLFACRAQVEEVGANASGPGPWTPGPAAVRFGDSVYGQAQTSDIAEDAATSVLVSRYAGAMTLVGPDTGTVIRQLYYTADAPCKLQIRLSYTYEKNVATVPNGSDPASPGSVMSFNLTYSGGGITGWPDTAFYIEHVGLEGVVSYTHTVNIPAAGEFRIFCYCTAITGITIYLYDPVLNVEVIKR